MAPLLEGSKPTTHRWRTRSWNLRSRMKTTRSSATSLPKSHVKLALPCELTRQNRHVHAGLPLRRTTTRSPTVRLNSKHSKATLTSRTENIRRQNIRFNKQRPKRAGSSHVPVQCNGHTPTTHLSQIPAIPALSCRSGAATVKQLVSNLCLLLGQANLLKHEVYKLRKSSRVF